MPEPSGFELQATGTNPLEGQSLDVAVDSINNVFRDVCERFVPYGPGGQYAAEVAQFADRQAEQAGGESVRLDGLAEQGEPTELASAMVMGFAYGVSPERIDTNFPQTVNKYASALGINEPDKIVKYLRDIVQTSTTGAADGLYSFLQSEHTGFSPTETVVLESAAVGMAIRRDPANAGMNALNHMIGKYTTLQNPPVETV